MKAKKSSILTTLIFLSLFCISSVQAQAPYSITVEPENANAAPGDMMKYTITINADPGFEDSISLELEITALTYNEVYMMDIVFPPYPVNTNYIFEVPEDVPGDVTAYGIIRAISGNYLVEEEVTIRISSGGIIGSIIGWILSVLNAVRNFFS